MEISRASNEVKDFEINLEGVKAALDYSILDYSDYGDNKTREMKIKDEKTGKILLTIHYAFMNPNAMEDPEVFHYDDRTLVKIRPKIYSYLNFWFTSGKTFDLTVSE